MTRRSCLMLTLVLPVLSAQDDAARQAAEKWLALLDQGKYKDAYKQASQHSRAQATSAEWEAQIKAMRDATGDMQSRQFSSAKPAKSMAGAPDGDYLLLEFSTAFANKPKAVEMLMLSHEAGAWKAAAYFIR
jgi:ferric-dicitrate binding protein FerR (iron transport regulator)